MRTMIRNVLTAVLAMVLLPGCLTFKEQVFHFDYDTGVLQMDFHDLRSVADQKEGGSDLEKDWAELKSVLAKNDEFDPEVVAVKSKDLYQDNDVLSGRAVYQVKCPKCFPSKLDVLKMIFSDGRWEMFNDEIFLVMHTQDELGATNGRMFKTGNNIVYVWPQDQAVFEFSVATPADKVMGDSLLPKFLSENKERPGSDANDSGKK